MIKIIAVFLLFSTFSALAQSNNKVEFLSITPMHGYTTVEWKTSAESKNSYFTIEKSKDGAKYVKLIDIPISTDNNTFKEYVETDYQPYKTFSYYRIKITDASGTFTYFPSSGGLGYNPAKFNEVVTEPEKVAQGKEIIVVLQDAEGTEYSTKLVVTRKSSDFFADDMNKIVPPGIYTVISASDENIYGQKVIVK